MKALYFDEVVLGEERLSDEYHVPEEEAIEFARKWDPQPFHINEQAARDSIYGRLTISACHTISISFLLFNHTWGKLVVIGGLEWNSVRFSNPVHPGDRLTMAARCIDKRESNSDPNRGILWFSNEMNNQRGESVLTYTMIFIVAKRP